MYNYRKLRYVGSCLLLVASCLASADSVQMPYDRISFNVSAEKEVENDVLTAVLFASEAGQDTALLSDKVNQDVSWALEQVKQHESVSSRTLGYTTNPVYKDNRVDGWQVSQNIELKSKDSKVLSGLLGDLQAKLRIDQVSYSISTEVRQATEETLISEALAMFKSRAAQVQANMQRAEYRVVRLNINAAADMPQPFPMARGMAMMAEAAPAPPSLDAGKQVVRVVVDAEIELSLD